jgi:ATP-dependent Clp protease ATP-binding subunit ClpA
MLVKLYQIYFPELAVYVKFKVLDPEEIQAFLSNCSTIDNKSEFDKFKKTVIDYFVFNLKREVSDSLRMMSRKAAEKCVNALYSGCVMLNPGLDLDGWINIAYDAQKSIDPFLFDDEEDDLTSKAFLETIKKFNKKLPKLDENDFSYAEPEIKTKSTKIKQITKQKFLGLYPYLQNNIIGQDKAVVTLVDALRRSQAGLNDENRPIGVFLFAGSSGVGKTHLANTLHKYLFGSDIPMVRIDCGEFQHKHENQKLIGSPPGYVGHEEGGQLVNTIKKNPNTVVLLDEVEKAHPDLWNTFLRVFDDGVLTDAKGDLVDFRNTVIIMTTNLGNDKTSSNLLSGGTGFNKNIGYKSKTKETPNLEIIERNTNDAIKKHFKPEFLNRIDKTIIFNYLSEEDCKKIAQIEMSIVGEKLNKKGYSFKYSDEIIDLLITEGIDSIKGARGLSQVRRDRIEDPIAKLIIEKATPRGSIFDIYFKEGKIKTDIIKPEKKEVLTKET